MWSVTWRGAQCECHFRSYTWQWNTMEATSRAATAQLDVTTRKRHWTHHWQSVKYCQWPWRLEGTITNRWSSGSVSDWVNVSAQLFVHVLHTSNKFYICMTLSWNLWHIYQSFNLDLLSFDCARVLYVVLCGCNTYIQDWLHGTVAERRSLAGELSLSCVRPAADA